MSKVQERDSTSFNDLASTTIAGQLESRLKELERNIAVARQFIKLADECYTQVRHEWELLQQDTHASRETSLPRHAATREEREEEDTANEYFTSTEKITHKPREKTSKTSGMTSPHATSLGAKPDTTRKKETEASNEKSTSPQRETKTGRSNRKGKTPASKE